MRRWGPMAGALALLANSGAEAVENAVKLARAYTGRPGLICFEGAYHGRTLLTLSLTSKYGLFKKGFGVITSYSIHYTKLYENTCAIPLTKSGAGSPKRYCILKPPARAESD